MNESRLAQRIADRGKAKRSSVGGVLLHTTGSGIVEQARKLGVDPEAFAVDFYLHAEGKYPHYLIAHDGSIYSFCDEMKLAAHAAWSPEERQIYPLGSANWPYWWLDTLGDGKMHAVPRQFYSAWLDTWQDVARGYGSPVDLLRQISGREVRSPNDCYIGVELLDSKPFTRAQHESLAALFADICERHELLDPKQIAPGALPQPWLCTHSDVSPMRRWQKRKDGSGFPWDPRGGQLDWRLLESLLRGDR